MNRYLLLLTVLAWVGILSSCKTSAHKAGPLAAQKESAQEGGLPNAGNENEISAGDESPPPALKGLATETVEFQGDSVPLTIIKAAAPSDFYEYRGCAENATCPHGTTATSSFVLPGLSPGAHKLLVRPCNNNRTNATPSKRCGPWSSVTYTQTAQRNEDTDQQLVKRSNVEERVKRLGQEVFNAVSIYHREIGSCNDIRVKKLLPMDLVKKYLRLGAGWIAEGLLDPKALLALLSTATGDQVVLVSSSTASLPGAVLKGDSAENSDAGDSSKSQIRDVMATISSVAGAGAVATSMAAKEFHGYAQKEGVRKELSGVAQKEAKKLAGDVGKEVAVEYKKIAQRYGHATTLLRVVAVGSLVYYVSQSEDVKSENFLSEFLKNAMLVDAGNSCIRSAAAVQKIVEVNRQAAKLRQEIAAINGKFALSPAQP